MAENNPLGYESLQEKSNRDFRKLLWRLLHNWPYVLGSILVFLSAALLINRYTTPVYVVEGTIVKIKNNDGDDLLFGTKGSQIFRTDDSDVERELRILASNEIIERTIGLLDFDVSYFKRGEIKETEVYPNPFFKVQVDSSSKKIMFGSKFKLNFQKGSEVFALQIDSDEASDEKTYRFGEKIKFNGFTFWIDKDSLFDDLETNDDFLFVVNSKTNLINRYRSVVNLETDQKSQNIFDVTIKSKIPLKDQYFLTTYFDVIQTKNKEDKNREATNSLEFIRDQLKVMLDTMSYFQGKIDEYKIKTLDFGEANSIMANKISALEDRKLELVLQNNYLDYLEDYVSEKREGEIFAPFLLGIENVLLNDLVKQYVESKQQAKLFMTETNSENPMVQYQDSQVERLEENILENVRSTRQENQRIVKEFDDQIEFYLSSLSGIQGQKRELYDVIQLNSMVEQMVQLLLQKQTEISVSMASTESDYRILDFPDYGSDPFFPNKLRILIIAFSLGLLVPIGFFYFNILFSSRISLKEELDEITDIPLSGIIGHSRHNNNLVVAEKPKSGIAESFRLIRSNIHFLVSDADVPVILVTSSISGEGKTFCSINLALSFAKLEKKVLLIGGDMRRPKIFKDFPNLKSEGLSNYLSGGYEVKDVIQRLPVDNLEIISSGDIPPNPSELLMNDRLVKLIAELKKEYDIILIDSPPKGLVTDASLLMRISDVVLYLVRQGVTKKEMVKALHEEWKAEKLKNISLLLNDAKMHPGRYGYSYGYGYGYGYGYYEEDKKKIGGVFSRIKSVFS